MVGAKERGPQPPTFARQTLHSHHHEKTHCAPPLELSSFSASVVGASFAYTPRRHQLLTAVYLQVIPGTVLCTRTPCGTRVLKNTLERLTVSPAWSTLRPMQHNYDAGPTLRPTLSQRIEVSYCLKALDCSTAFVRYIGTPCRKLLFVYIYIYSCRQVVCVDLLYE